MTLQLLLFFTLTTALACFTPGPAAMLVASVGTSRRTALVAHAIAGIALANVLFFALSAAGIASLLLASPALFAVVRWLGAAYLVYLGLRLLFAKGGALSQGAAASAVGSPVHTFAKGFAVEVSNPKALLYFSALLPQFITPSVSLAHQFLTFCFITVVLDVCAYAFYGAIGFGIARLSAPSLLDSIGRVAGVAFVIAGIRLARA